ncbi:hypothetical protein [Halalkalibacterium ligniniphilum]|uniref:hypothetical protein n=1 Tax=Halalkalibacterium ligniniphilum TaxID=1134413 RepID=UPI00034B546F|nr:hypothetical protein [Halalkalibacterium ligniniphilum]
MDSVVHFTLDGREIELIIRELDRAVEREEASFRAKELQLLRAHLAQKKIEFHLGWEQKILSRYKRRAKKNDERSSFFA